MMLWNFVVYFRMGLCPKLLQAGSLPGYHCPGNGFIIEGLNVVLVLFETTGKTRTRSKISGE